MGTEGGIQKFTGHRQSQRGDIQQQLTRQMQTPVNMKTAVQIRVIDQSFPTHDSPGFLKIDPHDGNQGITEL